MKQRTVIKQSAPTAASGLSGVLTRAAEDLRAALEAEVVFASLVDDEGTLHPLGVAPAGKARFAPVTLESFPEDIGELDDHRRERFLGSYRPAGSGVIVSIPVVASATKVLVTVVVDEPLRSREFALVRSWSRLLGERLDGERVRQALASRDALLGQLREVLDTALTLTGEAVVAIDLDGRVIRWNQGSERLYGWSCEEALGAVLPMVDPARHGRVIARVRELAATGAISGTPGIRHRTRDGRALQVHATMLPLFDGDGDVYAAVSVMRDENAVLTGTSAPSAITHAALARLTAPVTAVSGFVQLLSRSDALRDPLMRENVLKGLDKRCREIADIAEELHLASRLIEQDAALTLSGEDLCASLRRAVDRVCDPAAASIVVEATQAAVRVRADAVAFEGSVAGLLRGLLRSHPSDAELRVRAESTEEGVALVITVPLAEDGGPAHPEAGLGMHLARLCADAHGGRFGVTSRYDTSEIRMVMPADTAIN